MKRQMNGFEESADCPSAVIHRAVLQKMFGMGGAQGIWDPWKIQKPFWPNPT